MQQQETPPPSSTSVVGDSNNTATTSTTTSSSSPSSTHHNNNNNLDTIEQCKNRIKDLENENCKLKTKIEKLQNANTNLQLQVEEEEELITNKLMKKLNRLKKEKETLVKQVEEEEELLTNTLQKKFEKVQQEKIFIENKLKQDREYIVNQLRSQLESVLKEKYDEMLQKLNEQVQILNKEQTRLQHDSDNYRQQNLKLLKEYSRMESENFILEQKIKRQVEKRKEMDSQKLQDEFDLEVLSEREFNQNIKSKQPSNSGGSRLSIGSEDLIERSRRSHSLPPSSQPPIIGGGVGVMNATMPSSGGSPLRGAGGSITPRGGGVGTDYHHHSCSPRKSSFSPKPSGIPIGGGSPQQRNYLLDSDGGLSSSLPTHSSLLGSSFAERLNQVNNPSSTIQSTDPYATTRLGVSPRLGSSSQLAFVRQSPRKH